MNIQIYGISKSFDTKKAERFFKERRITYQYIDISRYGFSPREFDSVVHAVGGIDCLIDWSSKSEEISLLKYLSGDSAKEDRVFQNPKLMILPVVRNGKLATAGYHPEIWETWK